MVSVMNDSTFLKELLPYAVIIPLLLEKILWYDLHPETTQKKQNLDNFACREYATARISVSKPNAQFFSFCHYNYIFSM